MHPFAHEEIAFPMAGHRPVFGVGGPFPNVERPSQLPLTVHHRVARGRRVRVSRPQIASQFLTQRAAGLDEQRHIDRLVRHAHLRIVGELSTSQPEICCGDHRSSSFASTTVRNRSHDASSNASGGASPHRGLVRAACPIAAPSAVRRDFARDRRW